MDFDKEQETLKDEAIDGLAELGWVEIVSKLLNRQEKSLCLFFLKLFIIAFLLAAGTSAVYFGGGTEYAYVHVMYVPIILSAFMFRSLPASFIAIVAGLLVGPLMPLNLQAGTYQPLSSWIMRTGYFVLISQVLIQLVTAKNMLRNRIIKANKKLEEINRTLEEKVAKRTLELKKISEERRELLHLLCHDLINPFNAIISALPLLHKASPPPLTDVEKIISTSCRSGVDIINLIREFESLDLDKSEIKLLALNLYSAIQESILIIEPKIAEKKIEIKLEIDKNIEVMVEPTSFIYTVMSNLLTNAVKFSYEGATLLIKAKKGQNATIILTVKDLGIGIPPSLLKVIFDIHEKTTRPGTKGEEGTGFGMPLVKKFVKSYGALIEISSKDVKSNPDEHGTEIKLTLNSSDI